MTPDPLLRGIPDGARVADVVCDASGADVLVAVVHRGGDGRLRVSSHDGHVGALEAVAAGAIELVGCGCYHRVDTWELERFAELAAPSSELLRIVAGAVSTR